MKRLPWQIIESRCCQCCVSGMLSWIFFSHIFQDNSKLIYCWRGTVTEKIWANWQGIIVLFTQNIVTKPSGGDPGSEIWDPEKNLSLGQKGTGSRLPNPWVKKAPDPWVKKATDPGSDPEHWMLVLLSYLRQPIGDLKYGSLIHIHRRVSKETYF